MVVISKDLENTIKNKFVVPLLLMKEWKMILITYLQD